MSSAPRFPTTAMSAHSRRPSTASSWGFLGVCLGACLVAGAVGSGCKKRPKPELSPKERCQQGCERRLACVEELALDKAVTEANREHLRRSQAKSHPGHLAYCLKACNEGQARFQAFARCGLSAKDCEDYFRCESASVKALEAMGAMEASEAIVPPGQTPP